MFKIEGTTIAIGFVAAEDIPRNTETLQLDEGEITKTRTKHSIEIDEGVHSLHESGIYINHSITPNCVVLFKN